MGIAAPSEEEQVDLERFRIDDQNEIRRVLRDLARNSRLITAYFNDGRDFILTALLGIDPRSGRMLLDFGPDENLNRALIEAGEAVIAANHNQVRVQFRIDGIGPYTFKEEPAFIANMPPSIIRIQRREYYRLSTPIAQPLQVRFMEPGGTPIEARVADISIGGLGILEPPVGSDNLLEPGTVLHDVRLELPGEGGIAIDMQIRNRFECGDGESKHRLGCMFINLKNRHSAAIQRYIHRIELERRRLVHG